MSGFFDKVEAAVSEIFGDHDRAALFRGDLDQSPSTGSEFVHGNCRFSPKGEDYRIVRHQNGRLGLQSLSNGDWTDLLEYDDGNDDYGRLHPARWRNMADLCRWSESGLRLLRENLLGIVKDPTVI